MDRYRIIIDGEDMTSEERSSDGKVVWSVVYPRYSVSVEDMQGNPLTPRVSGIPDVHRMLQIVGLKIGHVELMRMQERMKSHGSL